MKKMMVFIFWMVAIVPATPRPVRLVKYENMPYDNNSGIYRFAYEQTDGSRHRQRGEVRNQGLENEFLSVVGEYSWISPNGVRYIVRYRADDKGYLPKVEEGPGTQFEVVQSFLG